MAAEETGESPEKVATARKHLWIGTVTSDYRKLRVRPAP
jgi:hypothetical protein